MSANITCRTCVYWQPPPERSMQSYGFDGDRKEIGQCRRHAPTLTRTDVGLRGMWPQTLAHHWCGEHGAVVRAEKDAEPA